MKLCVITSSFPASPADASASAGLFVRDFCVALTRLGHDVTVVTPDKTAPEKSPYTEMEVRWFSWRGGDKPLSTMKPWLPKDALSMASLFRRGRVTLDSLVAEKRFDHVMAMWAAPAGVLAMGLKKRHGIPFSTWCLGSDIWTYGKYPVLKNVIRQVIRESDRVYADGLALAEAATRLGGRACSFLPSSRMLDSADIAPVVLKTPGPNFLFIGRYNWVKGADVLLEAMAQYLSTGHAGHLHLFGGGPMEGEIRARARRRDLRDHVSVGGFADEAIYVSHLKACDAFIIPSRMESIPVSFSDALRLGRPVIVSDVGDMGRLLRKTPAGLVVPPEDVDALCAALVKMSQAHTEDFEEPIARLAAHFDIMRTAKEWIKDISAP